MTEEGERARDGERGDAARTASHVPPPLPFPLPDASSFALLEVARTGLTSILLHPLRAAVPTAALVLALLPYLVGLGLSRGIQDQAEAAVRFGADLYVQGEQFGRPVPIPLSTVGEIRKLPGVVAATPRIVGRVELGRDRVSAV